jgi:hypothetical protein
MSHPISQLSRANLHELFNAYNLDVESSTVAQLRARFIQFLTNLKYRGPKTFEHLMKVDVRDRLLELNRQQEQITSLENFVARSVVRPLDEIQTTPPYNTTTEIETILNETNVNSLQESLESNYVLISPPNDITRFNICLNEIQMYYPRAIKVLDDDWDSPLAVYYFNHVLTTDDFHTLVDFMIQEENVPVKITYGFHIIIEHYKGDEDYEYEAINSFHSSQASIPFTYNPASHTDIYHLHDLVDAQISQIIGRGVRNGTSKTRFIAICNFIIRVARLTEPHGRKPADYDTKKIAALEAVNKDFHVNPSVIRLF